MHTTHRMFLHSWAYGIWFTVHRLARSTEPFWRLARLGCTPKRDTNFGSAPLMLNNQYTRFDEPQGDAVCASRSFDELGAAHVRALMVFAKAVSGGALGLIVIGAVWFGYILVNVGN